MHINVRHTTSYNYEPPVDWTVQLLRLCPTPHAGQKIAKWTLRTGEGQDLPSTVDGYGNVVHLLSIHRPHDNVIVVAAGEVETINTHGIVKGTHEALPTAYYLRTTELTQADDGIRAIEAALARRSRLSMLHQMMATITQRVVYTVGSTEVDTTAAEALKRGEGVCQDHAHIFIAGARLLGCPARYVSGYLWDGSGSQSSVASHAWAEAYIEDLGWVGFDPANGICPTEAYIRVATGLDYREAAPVRGMRQGIVNETLAVQVDVQQVQAQQ
jgi:transglutaminase-like putative cysteine protease